MIQNVKIQSTYIDMNFYVETQNEKNHGEERGRIHYLFSVLQKDFLITSVRLSFLRPLLVGECWSISKLFGVTDGVDLSP